MRINQRLRNRLVHNLIGLNFQAKVLRQIQLRQMV